jgi:hypothetical protein
MTFVGKILVIVIMVFSLFFLALSTVVFTTSVNWEKEVTKLKTEKTALQGDKQRLQAEVGSQKATLDSERDKTTKEADGFRAQVKDLTESNARRQAEITAQRTAVETALQEVKKAQDEAEARISEAKVLATNLQTVQKQRDEFKLQQIELDQQILVLKRELEVAQNNNKNLRERVAALTSQARKAGLRTDITSTGSIADPPDVEGEVLRVDPKGTTVEISIGKDDGLVVGHELTVYRTKPLPEYIGKVRILSVDPDQAAARVIGSTYHGKKIQEGDSVSTKVRPRS